MSSICPASWIGGSGEHRLKLSELLWSDESEELYIADSTHYGGPVLIRRTRDGNSMHNEKRLLEQLRHPQIAKLEEVFTYGEYTYGVLQDSGGGTVQRLINEHQGQGLEEWRARSYFQQIVLGVDDLQNKQNIFHGDICLEKIVLNDAQTVARLACFGFAQDLTAEGDPEIHSARVNHQAPEILKRIQGSGVKRITRSMVKEAEVFPLGIILYSLLFGKCPFEKEQDSMSDSDFVDIILEKGEIDVPTHQEHPQKDPIELSSGVQDLLKRMLQRNPKRRITIEEIFQHPWFRINLPPNWDAYNLRAPPSAASVLLSVVVDCLRRCFFFLF